MEAPIQVQARIIGGQVILSLADYEFLSRQLKLRLELIESQKRIIKSHEELQACNEQLIVVLNNEVNCYKAMYGDQVQGV